MISARAKDGVELMSARNLFSITFGMALVLLSGESSLPGSAQAGDGVGGPSVTRVTAPLTAWSADIARPGELPCALQRAVAIAMGEARPVHLNVPTHVAACEISL